MVVDAFHRKFSVSSEVDAWWQASLGLDDAVQDVQSFCGGEYMKFRILISCICLLITILKKYTYTSWL